MSKVLHPHQQEVVDDFFEKIDSHGKFLVEWFCGAGKSLVMQKMLTSPRFDVSAAVLPSLALVRQFKKEYLLSLSLSAQILEVSSAEEGATQADVIESFLTDVPGKKIVLVCTKSLDTLMSVVRHCKMQVDCILFDEAHNCARRWLHDVIQTYDEEMKKQVFFTATPESPFDHEKLHRLSPHITYTDAIELDMCRPFKIQVNLVDKAEMDPQNYDLETMYKLMLKDTRHKKVLSFHPDVHGFRNESALLFTQKLQEMRLGDDFGGIECIHADVKGPDRDAIFARFEAANDGKTHVISSVKTIGEGVDVQCNHVLFMYAKKNKVQIVQNLGRAVRRNRRIDKEDDDCVVTIPVFVDRAALEACSTKEEKSEFLKNHFDNFAPLIHILAAFQQFDPDMHERLLNFTFTPNQLRKRATKQGWSMGEPKSLPALVSDLFPERMVDDDLATVADEEGVHFVVHSHVPGEEPELFGDSENNITYTLQELGDDTYSLVTPNEGAHLAYQSCPKPKDLISFQGVSALDGHWVLWDKGFGPAAIEFIFAEKLGHFEEMVERLRAFPYTDGPKRGGTRTEDEIKLATFCQTRRQEYRRGTLSKDKIAKLQTFSWWSWEPRTDAFDVNVRRLHDFPFSDGPKNGGTRTKDEAQLAIFRNNRIKDYKNGILSDDRIDMLKAISWWSWNYFSDAFDSTIQSLLTFYNSFKDLPKIKGKRTEDEHQLATFCSAKRAEYKKNKLSAEKITALESIPGWSWDIFGDAFDVMVQRLKAFPHGDGPKYGGKRTDDEAQLASFCRSRRSDRSRRKLSADEIDVLQSFSWWSWDVHADSFDSTIQSLLTFYNSFKDLPKIKGKRTEDEHQLATFCSAKRAEYKKNKLSAEKITALESIPGWSWDIFGDAFDVMVQSLRTFLISYEDGPKQKGKRTNDEARLATFCSKMRQKNKNNTLSADEIATMDSIPWWDWNPRTGPRRRPAETAAAEEPPAQRPRPLSNDERFALLTEEEKDDFFRSSHSPSPRGYVATNPDAKTTINTIFAKYIDASADAYVIFLDHTDFKTAHALKNKGIHISHMIIPQMDRDAFQEMKQHPVFGACVVEGEFCAVLRKRLEERKFFKGVYADFCGPVETTATGERKSRVVELLHDYRSQLVPGAVLGITIASRNPAGVSFAGHDTTFMTGTLRQAFSGFENLCKKEDLCVDEHSPYAYGEGVAMRTWIVRV